jgi:hypothetical protein
LQIRRFLFNIGHADCHILTHAESAQGMFGMVTAMIVK